MKSSTGINYLFCRNGRYTVRVQVPKDLQATLNRTEFKRSLGADFTVAKRKCHSVIADFQHQIDAARVAANSSSIAEQGGKAKIGKRDIEAAVRAHYRRMRQSVSRQGNLNLREKIASLKNTVEAHLSINAHELWPAVSNDAIWLCEELGWSLDENSSEFTYLCETMLRARVQAYRDEIRRLEGKRSEDPEADPLFNIAEVKLNGDKTLGDLMDEFNEERAMKWSASTKVNYRIINRVLEGICGRHTRVSDIDRAFCLKVRDTLIRLPSNYQKKPQTKGKPISEVVEIGDRLNMPKMLPATVNSHLSKLGAIIAVGRNAGLIAGNPMANIEVADDVRPEEKRDPFSISQLNQIFSSAPWSIGAAGVEQGPSKYWGPLVALFSGARLSEIFGQRVDELIERDGVLLFDFRHRPGVREMKHNKSRVVPVHKTLLALGFAHYVNDARKSGRALLFPDAKRDARGKWGDATSDWFSRRVARLGLVGTNLSFHSFRHSFEDALREADLHNTPIANQITGRWTPGTSAAYGNRNQFSTSKLTEAMDKVVFPGLEIGHLFAENDKTSD